MRGPPSLLLIACAMALISVLAGCASQGPNRVFAGEAPAGSHSVFVIGHGYHTGLVVRTRDLPSSWPARDDFGAAEFVEIGWGARDYYPLDDPSVWQGLRVLLKRSASTIFLVPIASPLMHPPPDTEVIELRLSDESFSRLLDYVRRSYKLDAAGRAVPVPAGAAQPGHFYESPLVFHMFSSCNVWVARGLEAAGLPIDPGAAITAGMLLRQVRRLATEVDRAMRPLTLTLSPRGGARETSTDNRQA